jgi:hypothetical protein
MTTKYRDDGSAGAFAAVLIVIVLAIGAMIGGCGVNEDKGRAAVEATGMTDVKVGSHPWFGIGCSSDDTYSSSFKATGANGKPVSGVICQKGHVWPSFTVRLD